MNAQDAGQSSDRGGSGIGQSDSPDPEVAATHRSDAGTGDSPSSGGDDSPADAARAAVHDLKQWLEYASYYLATQIDSWKLSIRKLGIYAALGVVALFVAASVVVAAAVLLVIGIAGGLAVLFRGHQWLANVATGVLILGLIGVGAWLIVAKLNRSFHRQAVKKYESRRQQQQAMFGRDVRDHAEDTSPSDQKV
jgi:ABC-type nickel/cobalt efflux system permease component RcnA